jgi:carbon-monoxide dehydrogenase medium subunit
VGLLADFGYEAKVLAGGQSLIPTMNFRLAQPAVLIDLNNIAELVYIRSEADGGLRIGAMTRQAQVEHSQVVARSAPLLHEAMPLIAHPQIRNRGTIGGSLAHADPASELPAVLLTLGGRVQARSRRGSRTIAAEDLFLGIFTTSLEPDEILTEVYIPPAPPRSGFAVTEVARRHGDYALVGVAAWVVLGEDGACRQARLSFFGVGDGPIFARQACALLQGQRPEPGLIAEAAQVAASADVDPQSDIHASAAYRRHLVAVLGRRALTTAFARAAGG